MAISRHAKRAIAIVTRELHKSGKKSSRRKKPARSRRGAVRHSWHGHPKEHARAAKKGWKRRKAKHAHRSRGAKEGWNTRRRHAGKAYRRGAHSRRRGH